jgi:predicted component of type VI protein secretion system
MPLLPPHSLAAAMLVATAVEELQELLPVREELTEREEALAAREEKAGILEKALAKVSTDLDAERTKA